MRVGAAVAMVLLVASSGFADIFDAILLRGMRLPINQEAASFLVRGSDCVVREVPWPKPTKTREATYYGAPPPGTIAIAHTHPDSLPLPSPQDVALAKDSGFDVYVVTRGRVWVAHRIDGRIRMVRQKERERLAECHQVAVAAGQ